MIATYCYQIPIVVRPNLSALRGKTVAANDRVAETWDAEAGRKRRQLYHHYYHYKNVKINCRYNACFSRTLTIPVLQYGYTKHVSVHIYLRIMITWP